MSEKAGRKPETNLLRFIYDGGGFGQTETAAIKSPRRNGKGTDHREVR